MDTPNSLQNLINDIKFATGLTQEGISERLGYSRTYLSDAIKKGGNKKLIANLEREFKEELENPTKPKGTRKLTIQKNPPARDPRDVELIESLKEQVRMLKKNVERLEGEVESNLAEIKQRQLMIAAVTHAALTRASQCLAKLDKSYQNDRKNRNIVIAESLKELQEKGMMFDGHM